MDYHAVPPPENRAGGDSKREDLCQQDSERVTRMTPGASRSGQLDQTSDSLCARFGKYFTHLQDFPLNGAI